MRIVLESEPFASLDQGKNWGQAGHWGNCRWIGLPSAPPTPYVCAFKRAFSSEEPTTLRIHVSADERYALYLDGERVGRGPERGDDLHWFFETFDLTLSAGDHILVAHVWALGNKAPIAQFSVKPGFLLCPEEDSWREMLATGVAEWQVKRLGGYEYTHPMGAFGVGHNLVVDGSAYSWGFEHGEGQGWVPAETLHPAYSEKRRNEMVMRQEHLLLSAMLPAMIEQPVKTGKVRHVSSPALSQTHSIPIRAENHLESETDDWQALLSGSSLTIPPHTRRRVLIDLENYYCAYPEVIVSGGQGSLVRAHWQEGLVQDLKTWDRGHRGEVEGKYFCAMWHFKDGLGDTFKPDGGNNRHFKTLWWQCGRYVELLVETDNHPLTIEKFDLLETHYPMGQDSLFQSSEPRLQAVIPIAIRGLQMCAHETYMDCPYFEQLMYAGDTRLECLVTYLWSKDDRLPRKALKMFDWSRLPQGFTQSRYPSRLRQIIPPFSLWWVAMLHDFMQWRGDLPFVQELLPGMRSVLDAFDALRDETGIVHSPAGWNYTDWVNEWAHGEPPGARDGISALLNWQFVYSLRCAAQLESECGEPELAKRWERKAQEVTRAIAQHFWSDLRGLFADNLEQTLFSEHAQCLAVLSGTITDDQRQSIANQLFEADDLTVPSVYFMHYYFEACRELNRMDAFFKRMARWYEMVDYDFKTTYENGNPHTNRSDCHAWGAHPLYHYFASVLGVQPSAPGCQSVTIRPQLGMLNSASGVMVHPLGDFRFDFRQEEGMLRGLVQLPPSVSGILLANGQHYELKEGRLEI